MKKEKNPRVHYLSLYSIPKFAKEKRKHSPSAQKMDYIVSAINKGGYDVNLVSFSESKNKKIYRPKKANLSGRNLFFLCPNVPGKYRESIAFRWFYHIYAKRYIKRGDILLVYHTNGMRNDLLRKLADKMSLMLVYEVEEIYAYANEVVNEKQVEEEIEFLQCADKYLFCSELLEKVVNRKNLPYSVVEGFYQYTKANVEKFSDEKIHCVYGGIIDEVKGGALRAVKAAKYLPENYVVHILGFGAVGKLKELIEETAKDRVCTVVYEGIKRGEEYIDFISKCDIGLSLQTMDANLCDTSFPSKLVLYMACGLRVVACKIKVLEISKMAKALTFYDEDEPQKIAEAIMSIDVQDEYDAKEMMDGLDKGFQEEFVRLIRE